jgi:hypothetical protein
MRGAISKFHASCDDRWRLRGGKLRSFCCCCAGICGLASSALLPPPPCFMAVRVRPIPLSPAAADLDAQM